MTSESWHWLGILHLFGDYVTQSHWMATRKTSEHLPAAAHAVVYAAPFAALLSWWQVAVIAASHFVIDRWRVVRVIVWAKNQAAPRAHRYARRGAGPTGYPADVPPWLAVWLMIIADNALHLAVNAAVAGVGP